MVGQTDILPDIEVIPRTVMVGQTDILPDIEVIPRTVMVVHPLLDVFKLCKKKIDFFNKSITTALNVCQFQ
jgi:hypothetical protein